VPRREDLVAVIKDRAQEGDVIITLGAGDITRTAHELLDSLGEAS
jgi:UDP-N-acetylmuramate-alanine ligase